MEISLQQLQENPELKSVFDEKEDLEKAVRIPYLIKNKILMSPGIWNGYYYKDKTIKSAYNNTDWDSKEVVSLFLDHEDERSSEWVGWIKNPRVTGEDIRGDLIVVDKATAIKLYAGAKFGISPKVRGQEEDGEMASFVFDNFSVVLNPAVKTAYINNSQKMIKESEELSGFEEIRKREKMDVAEFYAIPRDPPSESKLPIYDAAHVRNALARFNQLKGVSSSERATARRKILAAAKKFDIEVSDKFKDMEENKMEEEEPKKEEEKEEPKEEAKTEEPEKTEEPKAEEPKEEEPAKETEKESEMKELIGKLTEILNQFQKKKEEDEPAADKSPEEEEPEEDKKKKVMSDSEMFEITSNPKWAGFVKEMKEKDAKLSLQEIAEAFKNQKADKMSEKISELSEKVNKFEAKLQEPAKVSMHAAAKTLQEDDPDKGFLQLLKERRM